MNWINHIHHGDALEVLKQMPDELVDCVITSPPYFGLRDYGVKGQIGLEKTIEEYVEKMVVIFREVRRVLKKQATLWLNLGDSFASGKGTCFNPGGGPKSYIQEKQRYPLDRGSVVTLRENGLKPKDLCMIPARVALALQADGWWVRQDIIWSKPNPMPESVTDRPTKSHEYLFLLSKNTRYFYDAEAIKEPIQESTLERLSQSNFDNQKGGDKDPKKGNRSERRTLENLKERYSKEGVWDNRHSEYLKSYKPYRNKRSVWEIATQPYPEAHFATFPEKLVEPCILAGCPKDGIVLDPFMGSGTVAKVAVKSGRHYIGIELNPEYIEMAERRLKGVNLCLT